MCEKYDKIREQWKKKPENALLYFGTAEDVAAATLTEFLGESRWEQEHEDEVDDFAEELKYYARAWWEQEH